MFKTSWDYRQEQIEQRGQIQEEEISKLNKECKRPTPPYKNFH